jgi:hypothetical protein
MFDAAEPDEPTCARCDEHRWRIQRVIVGADMLVTIEKVCLNCDALGVAGY